MSERLKLGVRVVDRQGYRGQVVREDFSTVRIEYETIPPGKLKLWWVVDADPDIFLDEEEVIP